MKRRIFLVCLFYCFFLDCRSTNLLRLFSGNLPAMFFFYKTQRVTKNITKAGKTQKYIDIKKDFTKLKFTNT